MVPVTARFSHSTCTTRTNNLLLLLPTYLQALPHCHVPHSALHRSFSPGLLVSLQVWSSVVTCAGLLAKSQIQSDLSKMSVGQLCVLLFRSIGPTPAPSEMKSVGIRFLITSQPFSPRTISSSSSLHPALLIGWLVLEYSTHAPA